MRRERICPRCGGWRGDRHASGESAIYQSYDIPDLCEPCWLDEDAEIEERGMNNLPDTLARYRNNMRTARNARYRL